MTHSKSVFGKGGNTPMKIYSYSDSAKPFITKNLSTHTQILDNQIPILGDPEPNAIAAGILSMIGNPD